MQSPLEFVERQEFAILPRFQLPWTSTVEDDDMSRATVVTLLCMAHRPIEACTRDAAAVEHPPGFSLPIRTRKVSEYR